MQLSEAAFQRLVIEIATLGGWSAYHTHDSRRSNHGWPDLVLAHPQRGVIFCELKSANGRVRPEQQAWLDLLTSALPNGTAVSLWRPDDMADIEHLLLSRSPLSEQGKSDVSHR